MAHPLPADQQPENFRHLPYRGGGRCHRSGLYVAFEVRVSFSYPKPQILHSVSVRFPFAGSQLVTPFEDARLLAPRLLGIINGLSRTRVLTGVSVPRPFAHTTPS